MSRQRKRKQANRTPDLSQLGDMERRQDRRPITYEWITVPHNGNLTPDAARTFHALGYHSLAARCPRCREAGVDWRATVEAIDAWRDPKWLEKLGRALKEHSIQHANARQKLRKEFAADGMYLEREVSEVDESTQAAARQLAKLRKHNRSR